ncbi:MAG: DUF1289 domain-containing protein [Neptuniibacter sp.]
MTFDPEIQFIESPCIRNCCLNDQDVCLGCFRVISEITGWNASTVEEKQEILQRCAIRKKELINSINS